MASFWEKTGDIIGVAPKTAKHWTLAAAAVGTLAVVSPKKTLAGAGGLLAGGGMGALKGAGIGFLVLGGLFAAATIGIGFAVAGVVAAPLIAGAVIFGLVGGVIGACKGALWGGAIGGIAGVYNGVKRSSTNDVENAVAARDNAKLEYQREMAAHQHTAQALGYAPPANPYAAFDNPAATTGHAANVLDSRAQLTQLGKERMN